MTLIDVSYGDPPRYMIRRVMPEDSWDDAEEAVDAPDELVDALYVASTSWNEAMAALVVWLRQNRADHETAWRWEYGDLPADSGDPLDWI